MAARSPSRYGKYEIVGRLATGGMADLFLARQRGPRGFEALAVVKRIRPHLAANPEFVRMFLDEARLAAQLRHPNVVAVFDAGEEHDEYFFVMEYVHGRDLRALLDVSAGRARPLTLDEALSLVVGVCAGLHHAHERVDATGRPLGIVHRDVSPSNVLIGFEGAVKLADFGIAKATQATAKEPGTNSMRGKLSYMSPEQCLAQPLDRRADLYALSVVLFELTTGARPFGEAPSEFLAMKQTLEAAPRRPSELRPGYPAELERIVMRGLMRDREQRWQSARDLQHELETFARQRQLALSPLTVTRLMEELFPDDLQAWHAAQSRGIALAEHMTRSGTVSLDEIADAPTKRWQGGVAPPAPAAKRAGSRLLVGAMVAGTMAAIGAGVLMKRAPAKGAPAAVAAPAATSAAPTAPAPPPTMAVEAPARAEDVAPARAGDVAPARAKPHVGKRPSRASKKPARARKSDRWDPEAPVLPH